MREPAELGRIVRNIESQFAGIDATVKVNVRSEGIASTIRQVKELRQATLEANSTAESLAKTFAISFKRFVTFSIATRAVGAFTSGLGGAFNEAVDFEKQMVRVSQVTGKTLPELRDLNKEITRLSVGLGVSSKTLLDVSLTLAQAGFTAKDTKTALEALAKTELAPTFTDIKKTTEGAIALFNQFGAGAEALAGQLGAINKVSADFAVESDDLIDVVRRVGGVFKSSGGDLNELLAIFTSIRATTRESAESIGTALKTIFVRIQRPQTLKYLKDLGVDLVDLEGKFVGPLKATKLLNEAFGKLEQGDPKFIQIAEELGGYRQIGKVIPLLQQYAVAQKALESAKKGQGSLDSDAAKAQETLANKIVKVKEEFMALVRSVYESPVFQTMANSSIQFASSLLKVADALKDIIPLIGIFATLKVAKTAGSFLGSFGRNLKNPQGFATGGPVPGVGNRDSVPAMLMPGEFVLNKKTVAKIGMGKLNAMNSGGSPYSKDDVQYFAEGGPVAYKLKDSRVSGLFLRPLNYGVNGDKESEYTLSSTITKSKGEGSEKKEIALAAGSSVDIHEINLDGIKDQVIPNLDSLLSKELEKLSNSYTEAFGKLTGKDMYLKKDVTAGAAKKLAGSNSVKSTISGYLFEPIVSAITGKIFEGDQAGFDFDFRNAGIDRENFGRFFTGNLSENAVFGDAKFSLTPESRKSLLDKAGNFILNNESRAGEIADRIDFADIPALNEKYKNINKKGAQVAVGDDILLIERLKKEYGLGQLEAKSVVSSFRDPNKKTNRALESGLKTLGISNASQLNNILKFASGGPVPGQGNKDTVPAMLTPGEFVLNKKAVKKYGMPKLIEMNGGDNGTTKNGVQYLNGGAGVKNVAPNDIGVDPSSAKLAILGTSAILLTQSLGSLGDQSSDFGKNISLLSNSLVQLGAFFFIFKQGLDKASDGLKDFKDASKKVKDQKEKEITAKQKVFDDKKRNLEKQISGLDSYYSSGVESTKNKINKTSRPNEKKKLRDEYYRYSENTLNQRRRAKDELNEMKISEASTKTTKLFSKDGLSGLYSGRKQKSNQSLQDSYSRAIEDRNIDIDATKDPQEKRRLRLEQEQYKDRLNDLKEERASIKANSLSGRVSNSKIGVGVKGAASSVRGYIKNNPNAIGAGIGGAGLVASQGISQYNDFKDSQSKKDIEAGDYTKARANKGSVVSGGLLSGAIGGAATGAAIGSLFGPIGVGVGAVAGGLAGAASELSSISDKMKAFNLDIFNATLESSAKSLKSFNDGLIKVDVFTNDLQKNFKEGSKANDEAFSQATLGEKAARYNPFKGTGSYENATYDPFAYIASGVEALGGGNSYRKNVYGETKADFDPKTTSGMRSIQNLYTDKEKKDYLENENKNAISIADNVRNVQGSTETKLKAYNAAIEALTTRSNELLKIDSEASRLGAERNNAIKDIITSEKALIALQKQQLVINTDRLKLSSRLNSISLDLEDKIANQKPETRKGAGENFIRRQEFADKNIGGSNNANLAIDNLIKTVTPILGANSKELAELNRQGEERKSINTAKDAVLSGNITLDRNDKTQSLVEQLESKLAPILGAGDIAKGKEKFASLGIVSQDLETSNAEASVKIGEKLQAFDSKYSEKNTQLKEAAEAEIRIREIMTKKVEESIGILERKNELDKASVKSLLDGDVMSFIKGQQAKSAQAAIASGDTRLTRSFGAQAIGGALQNAEDQKSIGAKNIYGMDINKFIQSGAAQGISLRGGDPELASAYSGQTQELAKQKRLLQNKDLLLAEGMKLLGTKDLFSNPSGLSFNSPKNQTQAQQQSSNLNGAARVSSVSNNTAAQNSISGGTISERDLSNLSTFSSSVKELSAAVEKLSQSKIQLSLAPTQHTVNITGSDVLAAIGPKVEELVYTKIAERFKNFKEELNRGRV